MCGVQFKISAKSFYQTNPVMTELLYSKAMEAAELKEDDVVFDAYSGIGTIGLIASRSVRKVLSVELVKEAVVDGKENAKRNGIDNLLRRRLYLHGPYGGRKPSRGRFVHGSA